MFLYFIGNLIILVIINIITLNNKANIISIITCCLINTVDNTTPTSKKDVIILYLFDIPLILIIYNINKNDKRQCILGRQFTAGVSKKYITEIKKLFNPSIDILGLFIIVGYIKYIIPEMILEINVPNKYLLNLSLSCL